MTIDHPVPATAPTGWKYRNGDSSTLPWSYTLSALPAFLRDGPDSPLSKFYTVPCTSEMPFPALPISFPNLATYLAAALEHARGAMGDGSSGARRLAKYVDQLYPNDRVELEDAQQRELVQCRKPSIRGDVVKRANALEPFDGRLERKDVLESQEHPVERLPPGLRDDGILHSNRKTKATTIR